MRGLILIVGFFVAFCGAGHPAGPSVPLNQRFTLAPGETAAIDSVDLTVQFTEVTGDSRCPADAVCIQGGDAVVHIKVVDRDETAHYDLHTGDSNRATATHKQVRISLVELQPYPFSSHPTAPGDYRATLVVAR